MLPVNEAEIAAFTSVADASAADPGSGRRHRTASRTIFGARLFASARDGQTAASRRPGRFDPTPSSPLVGSPSGVQTLRSRAHDVQDLARVLRDDPIGGFEVDVVRSAPK
jgi:hypothetical protein